MQDLHTNDLNNDNPNTNDLNTNDLNTKVDSRSAETEPHFMQAEPYTVEADPYREDDLNDLSIPKKRNYLWGAITIIVILSLISFAVIGSFASRFGTSAPELPPPSAPLQVSAPSPTELSNSFREIARAVKPAVVNVNIVETVSQESSIPDIFGFGAPGQGTPRRRPGTGSGFIVTQDGYILTNHHVVGNADRIEVTLSDGRRINASLVGTDPETDIAVIKIDGEGFPTAALGDSDAIEQGDWVLALGSPFGLQQTLTAGIVSATGRELSGRGTQYSRFIQTDASINPGNSGGPLVNMRGEVVGINTLIFSQTGSNVGIGFSIASNVVRGIFNELAKSGKVTRGYLGVNIQPLDGPRARAYGLEPNSGVLVASISDASSPAGKAGLQSGDVITSFDSKKVRAPRELTDAVAATPVGKSVRVDFIRNGNSQSATIEVAERPTEIGTSRAEPERSSEELPHATRLGITAQTVTPELASRLNLSISSGALVQSVTPGTPASEAGLRRGDVIHRIDKVQVKSVEDVMEAVKSIPSGDIALQIERNGQMAFIVVTMD